MKKGSLGSKLGVLLTAIICLVCAVAFWLFVKYGNQGSAEAFKLIGASVLRFAL